MWPVKKTGRILVKKLIAVLTAFLFLGFASLGFANGFTDFDIVDDGCDGNADGTDVDVFFIDCSFGDCFVGVILCGDLDDKAKYRLHFDTTAPFFDDDADCLTTSDDTSMYRPRSLAENDGKLTGPVAFDTLFVDNFLGWLFDYEALGVSAGDYFAVWVDVHKRGVQDRAPNTDDIDGCAKPQDYTEVLNIQLQP